MFNVILRKVKRKLRILYYEWALITGIVVAAILLLILQSISGRLSMQRNRTFEEDVLGKVTLVDQPFCKIISYKQKSRGHDRDKPIYKISNLSSDQMRYTELLALPDGSHVVYKRVTKENQNCLKCCAKHIHLDSHKAYIGGRLPKAQIQAIFKEHCRPFMKIFPVKAKHHNHNFILTNCQVQCSSSRMAIKKPTFTQIHPVFTINAKIKRKLEYWNQNQQNLRKRPLKVLLLNMDTLSRAEAVTLLPKSLQTMHQLGFIQMYGHSLIGGASISNYVGSLTGLSQEHWDAACGFSETGRFSFTCPWIWKDFGKAHFVTAYIDVNGMAMFRNVPTDYYLGQDIMKLLNLTTGQESSSIDVLLDYTLQFNQRFAQYPTFSITRLRLPSNQKSLLALDYKLSRFLLKIKDLKDTFIAIYSNNGPIQEISGAGGPNLERFNPVLFIRRFRNPTHSNFFSFDSALVRNSRLFTTVWDFHDTLRHILRMNCLSELTDTDDDQENTANPCFNQYPPFSGASSLLTPISQYRSCQGSNVPAEVCPCNRALTSAPFLTNLMPLTVIAITHLNRLVPQYDRCSKFQFVTLHYAYVVEQEDAVIGISVKAVGGNRKQDMRVEQRISMTTRKAVGFPLWTSYPRPNGFLCLKFPLNPKVYFMHKMYCLCK